MSCLEEQNPFWFLGKSSPLKPVLVGEGRMQLYSHIKRLN